METLSPSPPPSQPMERYSLGLGALHAPLREHVETRVFVAVGRSPEKTLGLLRWAFRRFGCSEIFLAHVHQPSPVIPTLLGKIPAAQATEELVLSHRKSEKEEANRILQSYLSFCHRAQVQASLLVTESEQIHDGIVTLVKDYGIRKLVMGSTPDTCFKLKASYRKASFMAKNAPAFCEIWFVWRGRHIWTREASAAIDTCVSAYSQDDIILRKRIRFSSSSNDAESILEEEFVTQEASKTADLHGGSVSSNGGFHNSEYLGLHDAIAKHFCSINISNLQDAASTFSSTFWPDSAVHMETLQLYPKEILNENLTQAVMEAERSKKEAFAELVKRKEIELKIADDSAKVKASEASQEQEIKMREELEGILLATRRQHKDLVNHKEKAITELESGMRRLAILDARAQRVALWMDEVAAELELIQSSVEILRRERPKSQKLEDICVDQVERCRYSHARLSNCNSIALGDNSYNFREFTLLDLQAATCGFSESFKIGPRGHGYVYKGEIMDRSVVIHKLQSRSIQSLMQFQQEVYILSKVRHPHLVTLIGACPEALCLVYDYLSNGSLQYRLFSKCNCPQLSWKIRARIIAEISSALLFLHSCKPQMIIHGDLKLENILLDSDFHCKIADFGISQLSTEDMKDSLLFCAGSELKGSFPYADPEYQRTKLLTPKSDVYSFGIIILQLITGKQHLGLPNEVRRAMSSGKLSSILDPTAGEWPMEVAGRLAEFGVKCSEPSSRDRPELNPETVRDLEQLRLMRERQVPSFFLCPIFKEIMHDPQVAADGFTYEARAIHGWFENGHETSPMTNLKLKHLNLTPNYALRFAIQDWLCPC